VKKYFIPIIFAALISTVFLTPVQVYAGATPEMALKCYVVITIVPNIDPPVVELEDQFGIENVDPQVGLVVCEEALKHSSEPPNDPRHWRTYAFPFGARDFGEREVQDQFGTETVIGGISGTLFTPATKNGQGPLNDQHWTAYGIAGTIDPPTIEVSDQFGTSMIELGIPSFFLTNTFKDDEGDPNGLDNHFVKRIDRSDSSRSKLRVLI